MYCLISVVLRDWRAIYEEAQGYKRQALSAATATGVARPPVFCASKGLVVLVDWDEQRVLGGLELAKPTGFAVDGGQLHVALWDHDEVLTLGAGGERSEQRIGHRWFNHIHTLDKTDRGWLLSSSGTDLIAEVDQQGELLWSCFMFEHGYGEGRFRFGRSFDPALDYNRRYLPAALSTHPNSAILVGDTVLATLFSTGELVAIDRVSGKVDVVLSGLKHPHSIRRRDGGGYMLSDTESRRVLLLDGRLALEEELPVEAPWIQDAVLAGERLMVVANRRIMLRALADQTAARPLEGDNYVVELRNGAPHKRLSFGPDNRIYMVQPVTGVDAEHLMGVLDPDLELGWLGWRTL